MRIRQNTAFHWSVWMPSVDDRREGAAGLTLAISLMKNGAALTDVTADCTVTDRGNGWYDVAHIAGHADTLGELCRRITATGAEEVNEKAEVVPQGIAKNAALTNFTFPMRDQWGNPKTGLTVTAQRSIDGAAYAACANAVTEIGTGAYKINLDASDLNGDVIMFKFTATAARQREFTIVTER